MRTKLTAIAAVAAAVSVTVAAVAMAGPVAAKQRVVIQENEKGFVLTPLTPGAIKRDTGTTDFCCWSERHTMRDGQEVDIDNPQMTLTGKRGTLVARNEIGWIDIPDGLAVMTGTWKVISGTGAYAGLVGGGRGAGVQLITGHTKAQFEGFLKSK